MTEPDITPENASALTTLVLIGTAGRTIRADGDRLLVSRGGSLPEGLRTAIQRNKPELLDLLRDAA